MKSRASSEPRERRRQLALGGPREKLRVVHPQHGEARFALEPEFVEETLGIANFQRPFLRRRPIAEPQGKSAGAMGDAEFAALFHIGGFHGAERTGEFRLTRNESTAESSCAVPENCSRPRRKMQRISNPMVTVVWR